MKIENLACTCEACPSQWNFTTDGDRNVYVRYRWGYLSVRVSLEPHGNAVSGPEVYGEQIGESLDGLLDWSEVESRIKDLDVDERLADLDLENDGEYPSRVLMRKVEEELERRGVDLPEKEKG